MEFLDNFGCRIHSGCRTGDRPCAFFCPKFGFCDQGAHKCYHVHAPKAQRRPSCLAMVCPADLRHRERTLLTSLEAQCLYAATAGGQQRTLSSVAKEELTYVRWRPALCIGSSAGPRSGAQHPDHAAGHLGGPGALREDRRGPSRVLVATCYPYPYSCFQFAAVASSTLTREIGSPFCWVAEHCEGHEA